MKTIYILILSFFTIFSFLSIGLCLKKRNRYTKNITKFFICTILEASFFVAILMSRRISLAYIFDSLYFASFPWQLYFFSKFIFQLSNFKLVTKRARFRRNIFLFFMIGDSVGFINNMFFHHFFTLIPIFDKAERIYYWKEVFNFPFLLHLSFYFLISINLFFSLVFKIRESPKYFKRRYVIMLVCFFVIVTASALSMLLNWPFDYSLVMYPFVCLLLTFFVCYDLPREYVMSMFKSVTENINAGVCCFDNNEYCFYANNLAKKIFGENKYGLLKAQNYRKNWLRKFPGLEDEILNGTDVFEIDQEQHFFKTEYHQMFDEEHRFLGSYIKFDDLSEELQRLEEQRFLASHDRLTGLYNREAFFKKCANILEADPNVPRYLICTNIKNFKYINDFLGTKVGDYIIIKQAQMLQQANYDGCVQGRISAERLAMLIPKEKFSPQMASLNTRRILDVIDTKNFRLHMYIGVYEISNPHENPKSMYDKANLAIEKIKGNYEHVLAFYNPSLMEQVLRDKNTIGEFQRALKEGQFEMYLQAQVRAENGQLSGAEALVRWNHPVKGVLSPKEFVKSLERTDYIFNLDSYIWEEAAKKLSQWKKMGHSDLSISVNISSKDFYYGDLVEIFTNLTKKYDISPENMNLEVTESVLMQDVNLYKSILEKLQACGFKIEMDDFGSGYSSLNILKDIHMDVLKIDMEFLKKTKNTERSQLIIKSIISMAKKLNMLVIAEGVETDENIKFLKKNGCDFFQGYYYSKPMLVSAFEQKYLGDN